ncbi:MAG: GvpL/GvpF family gas vesicle protein [Deltaproteobacteria bacterium]|nr:GvpL/GvpF family gas vesicle protein [Deltaproteobacteria bacterium]
MSKHDAGPLDLCAVIPGNEANRLCIRGCYVVLNRSSRRLAAIIGRPPDRANQTRLALWHARVVANAQKACSAVIPFRLGIFVSSESEIARLLEQNADTLDNQLRHFRGRVEMGVRAVVRSSNARPSDNARTQIPVSLDRVRALAPRPEDRRERLMHGATGLIFEGCFLIPRLAAPAFWRALDDVRRDTPQLPLLGSGPWAPFSFCEAPALRLAGRSVNGRGDSYQYEE